MSIKWLGRIKKTKAALKEFKAVSVKVSNLHYTWSNMLTEKKCIHIIQAGSAEELTELYNEFLEGQNKVGVEQIVCILDKNFSTMGSIHYLQIEYTMLWIKEVFKDQYYAVKSEYHKALVEKEKLNKQLNQYFSWLTANPHIRFRWLD